jgi:hypothetical protein
LVVGIIFLVGSVTIVGGVVVGVAAAMLGTVAHGRVKRGQATNRGAAVAGVVLGIAAIVASFIVAVVAVLALVIGTYEHCHGTHPASGKFCD